MTSVHKVTAHITFARTEEGGLHQPMANPSPSLIFCFRSLGDEGAHDDSADVQLGAVLDVGEPLVQPGTSSDVQLTFWSDLGRIYATVGATFLVWYAGRTVGEGCVIGVTEPPRV